MAMKPDPPPWPLPISPRMARILRRMTDEQKIEYVKALRDEYHATVRAREAHKHAEEARKMAVSPRACLHCDGGLFACPVVGVGVPVGFAGALLDGGFAVCTTEVWSCAISHRSFFTSTSVVCPRAIVGEPSTMASNSHW